MSINVASNRSSSCECRLYFYTTSIGEGLPLLVGFAAAVLRCAQRMLFDAVQDLSISLSSVSAQPVIQSGQCLNTNPSSQLPGYLQKGEKGVLEAALGQTGLSHAS